MRTSTFSWELADSCIYLWVQNNPSETFPFTYTIQECLEEFCEEQNQIFKRIDTLWGSGGYKHGIYKWIRP